MILSSTITTRRKKKVERTDNMDEEKDIMLKDLYKLTLSMKDGLTNKIDAQKRKTEGIEDKNEKLSKEVKEQGKLIRQLTARVKTCEATAKFHQIQIKENRDDIKKINIADTT